MKGGEGSTTGRGEGRGKRGTGKGMEGKGGSWGVALWLLGDRRPLLPGVDFFLFQLLCKVSRLRPCYSHGLP